MPKQVKLLGIGHEKTPHGGAWDNSIRRELWFAQLQRAKLQERRDNTKSREMCGIAVVSFRRLCSDVTKSTSASRRLIATALSPGLSFVTAWFSVGEIAAVNVVFVDNLVVLHFGLDRSCFVA
jgi:hypothetical protein